MAFAPDAALAARVADQHGVFPFAHARACGLSRSQVHRRRESNLWVPVHELVYALSGAPLTWKSQLLAACWAGGHRAWASHRSAAALLGLPGGRHDLVEITAPRWLRARHEGIVCHETKAHPGIDLVLVDGIPTTGVERTLVDIAAVVGRKTLALAVDAALRRGLTTVPRLQAKLRQLARPGRKGIRALRAILAERAAESALTESEAETLMVEGLREANIGAFVLQHSVHIGSRTLRFDAAVPEVKVAIEYDSYLHHGDRQKFVDDLARRNVAVGAGWAVFHVTAPDLRDPAARWVAPIRAEIERRRRALAS